MKKDFLNISPESGGGSTQISVTVDPNVKFESRETTLNFSSTGGGINRAVTASQLGVPFSTHFGANFSLQSSNASPGRNGAITFTNINPTGGTQGCQKIGGNIFFSYSDPNDSEFTGEFIVAVLTSLLEGKDIILNSKMSAGNRTVYEDNSPMSLDREVGEYSIFSMSFGSTYIEDSDKFVASIGIGNGSTIETYLTEYDLVVSINSIP